MFICTNLSRGGNRFMFNKALRQGCNQNVGTTSAVAPGGTLILVMPLTSNLAYHQQLLKYFRLTSIRKCDKKVQDCKVGKQLKIFFKNYHNKSLVDQVYLHYGNLIREIKCLFELHFELQEIMTTNVSSYPNFCIKKLDKE